MLVLATIALLAASLARAATHTIAVGANGNTFDPTSITANPGDVITFSFKSGSHTATQSTFAAPCTALQGGVDSGSKPAAGAATPPTFNYTVADTKSVWFYCATGTHCKSGMVFAINPTSTQTFGAFQAAAKGDSSSSSGNGNGYGYGNGGASGRASIGIGAVAGALTLGVLAGI
jgi:plastocyanin